MGTVAEDAPLDTVLERQELATKAGARYGLAGGMPFGTQYGFAPLPAERDTDRAWRAVAPDVDVLIGSGSDEAGTYVPLVPGLGEGGTVATRATPAALAARPTADRGDLRGATPAGSPDGTGRPADARPSTGCCGTRRWRGGVPST